MLLQRSFAWAASVAVMVLAGCASQPIAMSTSPPLLSSPLSAPAQPAVAAGSAASLPSMQIPADAAKRMVLNMQLAPQHAKDSGWAGFKKEWHDITKEQSAAQGVAFAMQDGEPQPTGDAGTLVVVKVNDYKHVGIAARIMFGVMMGNAYIDAQVEFRDLATGKLYGERTWQGVFAAVTPRQIYSLADQLLKEMKGS